MKTFFALFMLALITAPATLFAQTTTPADCDQLRSEVDYLRKALKMQSEPVYTDVIDGIEVKVLSVEGSKRAKVITVNVLVTSLKFDRAAHIEQSEAYDVEGNKFDAPYVELSAIYADIPRRATVIFGNVNPEITNLRMLKYVLGYLNTQGTYLQRPIEYRNVKINWQ